MSVVGIRTGDTALDGTTGFKNLWGWAGAGNYCTFTNVDGTGAYQVPASKRFVVTSVKLGGNSTASAIFMALAVSTADGGQNNAAAPTGFSERVGSGAGTDRQPFSGGSGEMDAKQRSCFIPIEAGKYISARFANGGCGVLLEGYEETV